MTVTGSSVRLCTTSLNELTQELESYSDLSHAPSELLAELIRTTAAVHDATTDYLDAIEESLRKTARDGDVRAYERAQDLLERIAKWRRVGGAYRTLSELRPVVPQLDRLLRSDGPKSIVGRVLNAALKGERDSD